VMKQVAVVAEETAKYSAVAVTSLLGATAVSLNIMVFRTQWKTYTVQEGDTYDSIGGRFTMTERSLRKRNGFLKKGQLRQGMKIRVRNRTFIEKDYLDQLKSVLSDTLKTRNHGHMAEKIEQMFAKK
jgi:LysM repeat protein